MSCMAFGLCSALLLLGLPVVFRIPDGIALITVDKNDRVLAQHYRFPSFLRWYGEHLIELAKRYELTTNPVRNAN